MRKGVRDPDQGSVSPGPSNGGYRREVLETGGGNRGEMTIPIAKLSTTTKGE